MAGSVCLVYGEAGIGKTSVVNALVNGVNDSGRVLRRHCDDLFAPSVLGPIREAIYGPGAPVERGRSGEKTSTRCLTELPADTCDPYAGAERLAADLGNGRLLTYRSDVHASVTTGDPCLLGLALKYLQGGNSLPAEGAVCVNSRSPFPAAATPR